MRSISRSIAGIYGPEVSDLLITSRIAHRSALTASLQIDGGMFMHDVLDNGTMVQCVASKVTDEDWDPKEWKRDLDREALENAFASWTNSPIVKNMIEVGTSTNSGVQ